MDGEFTCELCGKRLDATWSEEEAVAELKRTYGDVPIERCAVVCEQCYQMIAELSQKVH